MNLKEILENWGKDTPLGRQIRSFQNDPTAFEGLPSPEEQAFNVGTMGVGGKVKTGAKIGKEVVKDIDWIKLKDLAQKGTGISGRESIEIFLNNLKNIKDPKILESITAKGYRDLFGEGVKDTGKLTKILSDPAPHLGEEATVKIGAKGKPILNEAAQKILDAQDKWLHNKAVQKVAARFGIDPRKAANKLKNMDYNKAVKRISEGNFLKRGLTAGAITMGGAWVTSTAVGIDILADWYALDNIAGGTKFRIKALVNSVIREGADPTEVYVKIFEAQQTLSLAEGQIDRSTKWNPFTWASKKLWKAGIEQDIAAIDDEMDRLSNFLKTNAIEKKEEEEKTKQKAFEKEEQISKEKELEAKQKAREEDIARRRKDSASVGTRGITQTPYEQKAPQQPSKLGFGLL